MKGERHFRLVSFLRKEGLKKKKKKKSRRILDNANLHFEDTG